MKISIITPIYNESSKIEDFLQELKKLTGDFEVLFADGGRWTIVGKAVGQRLETVVTDADGNSEEVVFAIGKMPDGRCRIESEDGSISAEN